MSSITIYTKNLVKRYGQRTVVNNVSFEVNQGEIVGLLGPNGAGKTTSFYQVVGLVKPDEGAVFLNDLNITKLPMYKRAQMGIGYLPQEASVFRKLSVEDNISSVLEMTKLSRKEQKEKLESLLSEFRLTHVRKSNGDVLSGGEIGAIVFCDAIIRLIPGVLSDETSALTDSFQDNLLSPPIYTRPAEYKGLKVPEVLLSGNFGKIEKWREEMAYEHTKNRRPDLLEE